MTSIAVRWGRRIREHRALLGLTQAELAAAVGVGQATVSKWERGQATPRHGLLPHLAAALRSDVAALFPYAQE